MGDSQANGGLATSTEKKPNLTENLQKPSESVQDHDKDHNTKEKLVEKDQSSLNDEKASKSISQKRQNKTAAKLDAKSSKVATSSLAESSKEKVAATLIETKQQKLGTHSYKSQSSDM